MKNEKIKTFYNGYCTLHIFGSTNIAQTNKPELTVDKTVMCSSETVSFTLIEHHPILYVKVFFGDKDKNGNEIFSYITENTSSTPLEHIYLQAGEYTVTFQSWYKDGTSDESTTEAAKITIKEMPDLTLSDDQKASKLIAESSNADAFSWYSIDRKGNTTQLQNTSSTLNYMESGEYMVTASKNGCEISQTKVVTYQKNMLADFSQIIVVNNVLTPNNDGINDVLEIEDLGEYDEPCIIKVFSKTGKLVYENNNYTNTDGFQGKDKDGNDLYAGTYYYVIKSIGRKGVTGFVDIIR